MNRLGKVALAAAMLATIGSAQAITVAASNDATALAAALGGAGITISNAAFAATTDTTNGAGTFTGGAGSVGFDSGVVLTTGKVECVEGPNNSSGCTGLGTTTALEFDFKSSTGKVFFSYVFGSEEYNEWVNSQYDDVFKLELNGVNLALVPGTTDVISVNTINCGTNSAYYKNNSAGGGINCANLGLDIQFDGLTVILTAEADVIKDSTNHFLFSIKDKGDSSLDSGVFIKAGSFSGTDPGNPAPEPGTLALAGVAMVALALARRRKAKA